MAKQVQLRRGTTAEHSTFTGAVGEITVDTTKDTAVVHDGSTVGGFPLLRESAYTAADVLTKIKTVDGAGSGLDADLLDGKNAADTGVNTIVQRNASGNALALGVATGTSFNSITGLASVAPIMDGTAAVGTSPLVARQDHIHPRDTSKISTADVMMAIGNINSPLLDMPLKNSLAMKAGVGSATFTRASTATYVDRYGVLKIAAIDEPRFEKEGYLNEGSSTNLLTYSEQFDNAIWEKANTTVSANTTETLDPYGTNLADKITATGTSNVNYIQQTYTVSTIIPYVFSYFVKKADTDTIGIGVYSTGGTTVSTTGSFTFSTETVAGSANISVKNVGNGWYRVSVLHELVTGNTAILGRIFSATTTLTNSDTSSFYIFGAQLEALPFATSYIPTVDSTVTASVNILNVTRENNLPNIEVNGEITVVFDIVSNGSTGNTQWVWGLYNIGTDALGCLIGSNGTITSRVSNSVGSCSATSTYALDKNRKYRITQVINSVGNSLYINGVLNKFTTNTTGKITDTGNSFFSLLRIGSYNATATTQVNQFYGHISNFRIYDKALTAQEVALV